MGCSARNRDRVREAAAECRARDAVLAADTLSPRADPHRTWSLELVCAGAGVPPGILERLAAHDLRLRRVAPQGDCTHAVAVV